MGVVIDVCICVSVVMIILIIIITIVILVFSFQLTDISTGLSCKRNYSIKSGTRNPGKGLNRQPNNSCPKYTISQNSDIPGFNISDLTFPNTTLNDCENLCDQNSCVWFNYDNSESKCYLKRGQATPNTVTGFKTNNARCPRWVRNSNTSIPGFVENSSSVANEKACQNECSGDIDCDWYSYNNQTKECSTNKVINNANIDTGIRIV